MEEKKVETFWEKGVRKCTEEPLVPVGALLTVLCLGSGMRAFHLGQTAKSQMLMRARVGAQAFTILAMGIGAFIGMKPHDRPKNVEEIIVKADSKN